MSDPKGHHTTLWLENKEATPVFEQIGDVYDMGEQGASRELSDGKPYGDTDDAKKSEATGLIDYGTQDFVLRFKAGSVGQQAMLASFLTGEVRKFQLRIADTEQTAVTMDSIVSGKGRTFAKGEFVNQKFTLTHNLVEDGVWA